MTVKTMLQKEIQQKPEVLKAPQPLPALLRALQDIPEAGRWKWFWELPKADRMTLVSFYNDSEPFMKEIR